MEGQRATPGCQDQGRVQPRSSIPSQATAIPEALRQGDAPDRSQKIAGRPQVSQGLSSGERGSDQARPTGSKHGRPHCHRPDAEVHELDPDGAKEATRREGSIAASTCSNKRSPKRREGREGEVL